MTRKPAVANQFYDADPTRLHFELAELTGSVRDTESAIAIIAPHAGYVYSGAIAGAAYARVKIPKTVIILGPNHTGAGSPAAVMVAGAWEMPMGTVPIASDLASLVLQNSRYLEEDSLAHRYEHSLEVQVPFLQYRQPGLEIVPICMSSASYPVCHEIGIGLAEAVRKYPGPVLFVASTDMTHYEPQEQVVARDRLAIDRILAMDPEGLLETVRSNGISMCGVVPTTITLVAAKALGAQKAHLVRHATSGDVSGDYLRVVGYASFIIE
ncbi:MAG TPA: AmmeMemoRadiSam system protein B [Thermodesulfobacteriaceae bacterium]|nr:AmmeMemoRadiSam system protein B [Thermodesulfobacteriaceae bacterium]